MTTVETLKVALRTMEREAANIKSRVDGFKKAEWTEENMRRWGAALGSLSMLKDSMARLRNVISAEERRLPV